MESYFHQDWPDSGGMAGSLEQFIRESTADELRGLAEEITGVLATIPDEDGLQALVYRLGGYVRLTGPHAYRDWLAGITHRARVTTAAG